jgi:hypothetical protein
MLDKRLDILKGKLTKTQISLDVMTFITTFYNKKNYFSEYLRILNLQRTSWKLRQAGNKIVQKNI